MTTRTGLTHQNPGTPDPPYLHRPYAVRGFGAA
jgi:hypothetical protein